MLSPTVLGQQFLASLESRAKVATPRRGAYRPRFLDSAAFAVADYSLKWLIPGLLVAGQPAILGGPKKALKTSIIVDLALSLGFGMVTKYLGHFQVEERQRVGLISGESGAATLQETAKRVCRQKNLALEQAQVFWSFNLPRLSDAADLEMLGDVIREHRLSVVILDPLYLCLLAGNSKLDAGNLYHIGPLLRELSEMCLDAGATPILVHHARKMKQDNKASQLLDLDDLSYSGVQEFARQWLLVGRREPYEHGSGVHKLALNVGGSVGHSGAWALNIDEGQLKADFTGRKWVLRIESLGVAQRESSARLAADKQRQQADDARTKVLHVMEIASMPLNVTEVADNAHISRGRARVAIGELVNTAVLEMAEPGRDGGSNGARYAMRLREVGPRENDTNAGDIPS